VAAAVNGIAALVLREGHDHDRDADDDARAPVDLNMRSALLHMVSDAAVSLGVAVAGFVILVTGGWEWLDPAVSLVVGALICVQAIRLLAQAVSVLLESTPSDISLDEVAAFIAQLPGIEAVHDLHVWSLSSELRAMSAHLVLYGNPTLSDSQRVGEAVKDAVRRRFAIAHTTFELESDHCNEGEPNCAADEATAPSSAGFPRY
jgi:cobalt-zinc-cadmium efflux system protein